MHLFSAAAAYVSLPSPAESGTEVAAAASILALTITDWNMTRLRSSSRGGSIDPGSRGVFIVQPSRELGYLDPISTGLIRLIRKPFSLNIPLRCELAHLNNEVS